MIGTTIFAFIAGFITCYMARDALERLFKRVPDWVWVLGLVLFIIVPVVASVIVFAVIVALR